MSAFLIVLGVFLILVLFDKAKSWQEKERERANRFTNVKLQDELEKKLFVQIFGDLEKMHKQSPLRGDSLIIALAVLYREYKVAFPNVEYNYLHKSLVDERNTTLEGRISTACKRLQAQLKIFNRGFTSDVLWRSIWNDYTVFHNAEHPLRTHPELLFCSSYRSLKKSAVKYFDKNGKEVFPQGTEEKFTYYRIKYNLKSRRMEIDASTPVAFFLINHLVVELTKEGLKRHGGCEYSEDRINSTLTFERQRVDMERKKYTFLDQESKKYSPYSSSNSLLEEEDEMVTVPIYGRTDLIKQQWLERKYYPEVLNRLIKLDEEKPLVGDYIVEAIKNLYSEYGLEFGYVYLRLKWEEEYKNKTKYHKRIRVKMGLEADIQDWSEHAKWKREYEEEHGIYDESKPLWKRVYETNSPELIELLRNPETNKILFFNRKRLPSVRGDVDHRPLSRYFALVPYTPEGKRCDGCKKEDGFVAVYSLKKRRLALHGWDARGLRDEEIPARLIDGLVIQLTTRDLNSLGYDYLWEYSWEEDLNQRMAKKSS